MTTRLTGLIVLLMIAFGILTGCGSNDSASQEDQSTWDEIKDRGTLVVGTSGTYSPVTYKDPETNKLTGFDVEIAREVAKRLDLEIEFKTMEFAGILPALRNGQIDLAANNFTINEERKKKFDFTIPYKYSYGTAVVRSSDNSGIESIEDFKGKKFGGSPTSNFAKFAREHGAEVIAYTEGMDTIIRDIAIGRIDGLLNDRLVLTKALEKMDSDKVKIAEDIKFSPNVGVMVMKKDTPELKENVDKVLKEMMEDGTVKEIGMKFFGADVTKKVTKEDLEK